MATERNAKTEYPISFLVNRGFVFPMEPIAGDRCLQEGRRYVVMSVTDRRVSLRKLGGSTVVTDNYLVWEYKTA